MTNNEIEEEFKKRYPEVEQMIKRKGKSINDFLQWVYNQTITDNAVIEAENIINSDHDREKNI